MKKKQATETKITTTKNTIISKKNFDCLKANKWLTGGCINYFITNAIQNTSDNQDVFKYAPDYILPLISYSQVRNVIWYFINNEIHNASYVLVPINTDTLGQDNHWVLGVVDFRQRIVYILNSYNAARLTNNNIINLQQFLLLISLSSRSNIDIDKYEIIIGDDVPQQTSSENDCGVAVISNALSIIQETKFFGGVQLHNFRKTLIKQLKCSTTSNQGSRTQIDKDTVSAIENTFSAQSKRYKKICIKITHKPILKKLRTLKSSTSDLGFQFCTPNKTEECVGFCH